MTVADRSRRDTRSADWSGSSTTSRSLRFSSARTSYPVGRFVTGALLLFSSMAFLLKSELHGLAEAAAGVAVLISIPILMRRWTELASRWAAILFLGIVSLAWTQDQRLTIAAVVTYVAVGIPALAAGAILRLSGLALILSAGFLGSAWMIREGVLFNPNTHAKLILLGCIALSAFLQGSRHRALRILTPIPLILALPPTVDAASTQVAIAWGVAILIFVFWRKLREKSVQHPALLVLATLAFLPLLAYSSQAGRIFWGSSATEAAIETGRLEIWRALWSSCQPNVCGFGSGLGTITSVTERISMGPSLAHNMFLLFLVELGVLGVVLVVRFLISTIGSVVRLSASGFPALIFASLAWVMSSDLFNMGDFYVITLWLAVGSCIQAWDLRDAERLLVSEQAHAPNLEKGRH